MSSPIHTIANHYGHKQYTKAIIELSKLQRYIKAYQKGLADKSDSETLSKLMENVAEGIASVEILTEQIKYLMSLNAEVKAIKDRKLYNELRMIEEV